MVSIYSPEVKREANLFGITELQAYRKLKARESILRLQASERNAKIVNAIHDMIGRHNDGEIIHS